MVQSGIGRAKGGQVRDFYQRCSQGQSKADLDSFGYDQRTNCGTGRRARHCGDNEPACVRSPSRQAIEDSCQCGMRLLHAGQRGRPDVLGVCGPGLLC